MTPDVEVAALLKQELARQETVLSMIPSENAPSLAVLEAVGSVAGNKYAEGYPGKRYYEGNAVVDKIELLAINRAKQLFNAEHVNVQAYSGSPANQAVFLAFLKPGDTFMGLDLACGGHLTHGSPVNFSGRIYKPVSYGLDKETELLDMNAVREIALREKPKLIISGLTAYPRTINFKEFQKIAEEVGAIHLADVSHIAGLIAGESHPSPFPYTDLVMMTTHKTLRGPRGALLLCKEKYAKELDKAVFPGLQGGPHENNIAGIAVALYEALQPTFKEYSLQIVKNASVLAKELMNKGFKLVTNGTDNHLILMDLRQQGISLGKQAAFALNEAGICCNMNSVPYDPALPYKPSGLRFGTPILTTRGMKEQEMKLVAGWITEVLQNMDNSGTKLRIAKEVKELCLRFPLYPELKQ